MNQYAYRGHSKVTQVKNIVRTHKHTSDRLQYLTRPTKLVCKYVTAHGELRRVVVLVVVGHCPFRLVTLQRFHLTSGYQRTLIGSHTQAYSRVDRNYRRAAPMTGSARSHLWYLNCDAANTSIRVSFEHPDLIHDDNETITVVLGVLRTPTNQTAARYRSWSRCSAADVWVGRHGMPRR